MCHCSGLLAWLTARLVLPLFEASSRVSFCEGESGPSWPIARCYLTMYVCHFSGLLTGITARLVLPCVQLGPICRCPLTTKRTRKIVLERERRNQCALPVDWSVIAESLGGGIDSRKEIDLRLLQIFFFSIFFFLFCFIEMF